MSFSFISRISLYLSFTFIISCQDTISSFRNNENIDSQDYSFQLETEEFLDFSFFEQYEENVIDNYTYKASDYNFLDKDLNVLKINKASSTELDSKCIPVIGLIHEWKKNGKIIKGTNKDLGGTMRLGSYDAELINNSLIRNIYKTRLIKERHRHRYEVNINYKNQFEKKGLIFSGNSPDKNLPEIIELKNHPWFIGVQFHPEFKSRPLAPHPLFSSFIKAAKNHKK